MRRLLMAATVFGAAFAAAAPAHADKQIEAGVGQRYTTPSVTMDQGERVTFVNRDVERHDAVAKDKGPDGRPLFGSRLANPGETVPVERAEFLGAGSYAFYCTIHPQMQGTLNVSGSGTPATRPPDTQGAKLGLRVVDSRAARVRRRRKLRVRISTDEAAKVRITARVRRRTVAKGSANLAGPGSRTVALKLTAAGRRRLRGRVRVTLSASATDSAGNRSRRSKRVTLRR
jgi:plastocyanin